jgi:dTDP-4-dehydrorhamnose reductase
VKIFLTGASGFVGSNFAAVFAARGAEVVAPGHAELDLTDRNATLRFAADELPDAIVHSAILNDPVAMAADRRAAWDAYVGATRNLADAADAAGAQLVLVSTDWVFDGTQGPATEDAPPNPINQYGFLKAASELVVQERAERGTVARIAGVQGVHRARPSTPRLQDHGFGYLVASVVEALAKGEPFTVWESDAINMLATPTLATDAGELVWRALEVEAYGVLHCCGGEHAERVTLARRAAAAFGLDPELVLSGPPPEPPAGALGRLRRQAQAVPYDTRLDATATARVLGVELPDLDTELARLRHEMEATGCLTT